jgi:hypothetical protein
MAEIVKSAWRRRSFWMVVGAALAAGSAGLYRATGIDEGTRQHIRKQLTEASRLPGRLQT